MKTTTGITRSLLLTSASLLIGGAIVSVPDRALRYFAQFVACSVAIARIEQLRHQKKLLQQESTELYHRQTAIKQKFQLATEETQLLVQYTDEEFQRYQKRIAITQKKQQQVEKQRNNLQLKLWTIEEQSKSNGQARAQPQLSLVRTTLPKAETPIVPAQIERELKPQNDAQVGFSAHKVAIVGGRSRVYSRVADHLASVYSLHNTVHVLSQRKQYIRRRHLHKKLSGCHLIVLITQYIGHPLKEMVLDLKHKGSIDAHILYINTTGYSGAVRDIDAYIEQAWSHTA